MFEIATASNIPLQLGFRYFFENLWRVAENDLTSDPVNDLLSSLSTPECLVIVHMASIFKSMKWGGFLEVNLFESAEIVHWMIECMLLICSTDHCSFLSF